MQANNKIKKKSIFTRLKEFILTNIVIIALVLLFIVVSFLSVDLIKKQIENKKQIETLKKELEYEQNKNKELLWEKQREK